MQYDVLFNCVSILLLSTPHTKVQTDLETPNSRDYNKKTKKKSDFHLLGTYLSGQQDN